MKRARTTLAPMRIKVFYFSVLRLRKIIHILLGSIARADDQASKSAEFEHRLQVFLRAHGVAFQTQEDIIRTNEAAAASSAMAAVSTTTTKLTASPPLTPDILISGALHINGREVRWIDAKVRCLACLPD